jgi:hypothetical protein
MQVIPNPARSKDREGPNDCRQVLLGEEICKVNKCHYIGVPCNPVRQHVWSASNIGVSYEADLVRVQPEHVGNEASAGAGVGDKQRSPAPDA